MDDKTPEFDLSEAQLDDKTPELGLSEAQLEALARICRAGEPAAALVPGKLYFFDSREAVQAAVDKLAAASEPKLTFCLNCPRGQSAREEGEARNKMKHQATCMEVDKEKCLICARTRIFRNPRVDFYQGAHIKTGPGPVAENPRERPQVSVKAVCKYTHRMTHCLACLFQVELKNFPVAPEELSVPPLTQPSPPQPAPRKRPRNPGDRAAQGSDYTSDDSVLLFHKRARMFPNVARRLQYAPWAANAAPTTPIIINKTVVNNYAAPSHSEGVHGWTPRANGAVSTFVVYNQVHAYDNPHSSFNF